MVDCQEGVEPYCAGRVPLQVSGSILYCPSARCPYSQMFSVNFWISPRGSLSIVRAKVLSLLCYRYYLYNQAFHRWQSFVSLQRDKKRRLQKATCFGMECGCDSVFVLVKVNVALLEVMCHNSIGWIYPRLCHTEAVTGFVLYNS